MKKSAKPLILFTLFYMVTITIFILGYVGIKLNCEELTRQKVLAEQEMENIKNWFAFFEELYKCRRKETYFLTLLLSLLYH